MEKKKEKQIIVKGEWSLDMLRDMLKDIPYYLDLNGVKLSALTNMLRKEMIEDIDKQLEGTLYNQLQD